MKGYYVEKCPFLRLAFKHPRCTREDPPQAATHRRHGTTYLQPPRIPASSILSGAIDLENLWFDGSRTFHISLKYIFSTTTWNRLTSLNFSQVTFNQGELLDLLRRHSGTLKDLWFLCVWLTNGSWKILLEGMKSSLFLQTISIDEPAEKDDEGDTINIYMKRAALKDYLLGDGPHPISDSIP
jgi:hypothetical protein